MIETIKRAEKYFPNEEGRAAPGDSRKAVDANIIYCSRIQRRYDERAFWRRRCFLVAEDTIPASRFRPSFFVGRLAQQFSKKRGGKDRYAPLVLVLESESCLAEWAKNDKKCTNASRQRTIASHWKIAMCQINRVAMTLQGLINNNFPEEFMFSKLLTWLF